MAWKLFFFFIGFSVVINVSQGASDNINKLAIANNNLGLKLYHLLAKGSSENVFFSPFSLANAFGILYTGAGGDTAKQLRTALGYDSANLKGDEVPSAFNQYLDLILPKNQSPNPEYVLNLANELLLANDFNVYPKYKTQVHDLFHAHIKEVDFVRNRAQILKEVNDWVNEQTHGKISKILSDLSPSTVMIILNAIYLKGTWKIQFDKKMTRKGIFFNAGSDSNPKEVSLMHLTAKLPYAFVGDLQALELPYKGDNMSMIVLLPTERNGLANLENNITPEKILEIQKKMHPTKVIVTFPKFKVEYQRTMNSDFKELGAEDMFKPGLANFSSITPNKGVYVSQVIHKAAIEVNEEGSEAAAVTAIVVTALATIYNPLSPPKFTADHPFMHAIIDKRNNLILFLGRVNKL